MESIYHMMKEVSFMALHFCSTLKIIDHWNWFVWQVWGSWNRKSWTFLVCQML